MITYSSEVWYFVAHNIAHSPRNVKFVGTDMRIPKERKFTAKLHITDSGEAMAEPGVSNAFDDTSLGFVSHREAIIAFVPFLSGEIYWSSGKTFLDVIINNLVLCMDKETPV